jgi:hypothetical protein
VVGTAKIMSYADIVEAKNNRAVKETKEEERVRKTNKRPNSAAGPPRGKRPRTEVEAGEREI